MAASVKEKKASPGRDGPGGSEKYLYVLERALWPELIIIGGGISAKHGKFFRYLRPRARLVPAAFLNEAGIVGAALWAAEEDRKPSP